MENRWFMRHPYIAGCVLGTACAFYWYRSFREDQRKRWSELCYIRRLMTDKMSAPTEHERDWAAHELSKKHLTLYETRFFEDCIRMQGIEFFEDRIPGAYAPRQFEKLPPCSLPHSEGLNVLAGRSAWDDGY